MKNAITFLSFLIASAILAETPLPEHPRPDWQRPNWLNLNGQWRFAFDAADKGVKNALFKADDAKFPLSITVPFGWGSPASGVTNNADSEIVDDPDSETGKAAVLHFRRPGRTMSLPLPGGFYDLDQKKALRTYSLEIPPEKRDGKYHWYNLGQVTIGRTTRAWFHGSWGIAFPFHHLYVNCDGAPADLNTYEMWVSVKVVGNKAIHFDRCVMRRIVNRDNGKGNGK